MNSNAISNTEQTTDAQRLAVAFSIALAIGKSATVGQLERLWGASVLDRIARHDVDNPAHQGASGSDERILASALKDIINSAENGSAYSTQEMLGECFGMSRGVAARLLTEKLMSSTSPSDWMDMFGGPLAALLRESLKRDPDVDKTQSGIEATRRQIAEEVYLAFDFGGEVETANGWETSGPAYEEWSRAVFIAEDNDRSPSAQLQLTVRFNADGTVVDAYALDRKGQKWGNPVGLFPSPAHAKTEAAPAAAADSPEGDPVAIAVTAGRPLKQIVALITVDDPTDHILGLSEAIEWMNDKLGPAVVGISAYTTAAHAAEAETARSGDFAHDIERLLGH
ncbi:hypothetical protein [Paraburkholderia sp. SIMBA_054]|uniref:hypothetical protein n=1 Tax=Paraburkholderia sp. SIMBA_054 TaxID=3085795 RepID=UPI00397A129F